MRPSGRVGFPEPFVLPTIVRSLLQLLVVLSLGLCGGCRRKHAEVPVPPPAAPAPAINTAPQPAPAAGAPMPPMTAEMMMKFEARFGRPPSNYTELSRLDTPPSPPKGR